jgi:hypothetical protein
LLFDGNTLTTHGVIVGMTGSGKTGLGFAIIEEALLNGISTLVLDPKGDMGNLLLNFPDFDPTDFRPWVDTGEAEQEGLTPDQLATAKAGKLKDRMARAGIAPDRIRQLGASTEMTIYTPGSAAGVGLNILGSLAAPDLDWNTDAEVIRDEIESFVSSVLVLAGIESDPVSGPEHILLATIIETFWKQGKDLDLMTLVSQVPRPPFRKLGVFELDAFFPEKERTELAMRLNGLLASPSFSSWIEGEPLDIESMLGGEGTKAAIVYLAHLTEEERQFVVTLILSKLVTWFRSRPGSEGLRTLVYLDEAFGYVPPTAEPPSKRPILTILKQARAFGVGMVLATQNPVDLDYKAMSNSGTWMIGRLQTENDKRRLLEGLDSADGGSGTVGYSELISTLRKRRFLLHAVREKDPSVFRARRSMSFRAGPLTRDQVTRLMDGRRTAVTQPEGHGAPEPAPEADPDTVPVAPATPEGIRSAYLDPAAPWAETVGADLDSSRFEPAIAVDVHLLYDDAPAKIHHTEEYEAVIYPIGATIDPASVLAVDHDTRDFLDAAPSPDAAFALTDAKIHTKTFWRSIKSGVKAYLVAHRTVTIQKNASLKAYSRVGETEAAFAVRCKTLADDAADAAMVKLEQRYKARIDRVKTSISKAENRVRDLEADAAVKGQDELLSGTGDLLGALLGGKRSSNPLGKAAKRRAATTKAASRADVAREGLADDQLELVELEAELAEEISRVADEFAAKAEDIVEVEIPLEKTDVTVTDVKLVWLPR